MALHGPHGLRPFNGIQRFSQTVRIRGDAHLPLAQISGEHGVVATFTSPVGRDLFIGEHCAKPGAPVHRGVAQIRQAVAGKDVGLFAFGEVPPRTAIRRFTGAVFELCDQFFDGAGAAKRPLPVGCFWVVPRVVDGQGNPLANQIVTFNVNGVFYNKVTNDEGIASLNIRLMKGEYIITSIYNGFETGNTIKIQ